MNKLFVLMGYPGCGKSSFIEGITPSPTNLILSSDSLREELFGFRDQEHNKELFDELYRRAETHKDIGDVYIDSTCLTKKDRMRLLNRLKNFFIPDLICILRPIDEIVQVNEERKSSGHAIPDDIFKRVLGRFQLPTYEEGWNQIAFVFNSTKDKLSDILFDYNIVEDRPHDNPHHPETIKEHIDFCVNHCRYNELMPEMVTLSKYHDLGKFYVQQYDEEKGYSRTTGHAAVSAYIYLMDASINYLIKYNKQQDILDDANRFFDIYKMSNISDILMMYYLIYYHDQPYACEGLVTLSKSLYKRSKPLAYLAEHDFINLEVLLCLLVGFNNIDRLRPE